MHNINSSKNIIDYWASVERFTPPQIETKNTIGYIESIQQTTLGSKDVPWQSRERFQHKKTPHHTRVYTIFLGILKCSDVTIQIKQLLNSSDNDFDLNNKGVSCLCSFQLNNYGEIIPNTFVIPDYFISISCLNQINTHPKTYISLAPKISKKFTDTYDNKCDVVKNRNNSSFLFDDLDELLQDLIHLSGLADFQDLISNTAIIYSNNIPVPNKFRNYKNKDEGKAKFHDIQNYETMLDTIIAPDYNILNSFYINDLDTVSNELENENSSIGESLREYLKIDKPTNRQDFRADKTLIKKYSHHSYLPSARWPNNPKHTLSLAQQIAVNLALCSKEGLFSINGPPGTGKSTLLRDIISGVTMNRAEALSKFDNPHDAFQKSSTISIERYNYKIWQLDPSLLGHEIVVASTNNAAVENISKELPRSSEIDTRYDLDYFSEIASNVIDGNAWGLGSAVLGNKTNRTKFFDEFWSKVPDENKANTDNDYGLNYFLNKTKPKSDWLKCRHKFLSTKAKFEKMIDEMQELSDAIIDFKTSQEETEQIFLKATELTTNITLLEEKITDHTHQISLLEDSISSKNSQLTLIMMLKPPWYVVLIDIFLRRTNYKDWNIKCVNFIMELDSFSKQKELVSIKIRKLKAKISKLQISLNTLKTEHVEKLSRLDECQYIMANMQTKYQWHSSIPDDNFWLLPDSELQMQSPWIHEELQDIRAQLFIDAMDLHKSFIINSATYITNNLKSIKYMMTNGYWPSESYDLLPHIWASFFMVVPTVSTTFASFSNLFGNLGADSIGYLLVDEAGQSAPQAAAGAIYRAKRTIIVGDPLQIQPVVTIPRAINQALLNYYKVPKQWDILEESVQTLADRTNKFGTYIGRGENGQWIGCPLRVHRRCLDPMFGVSNSIAYDNLMIQATNYKKPLIEPVFSTSQWIDVSHGKFNGNWSQNEGEVVLQLLSAIINSTNSLPSLCIISPFKHVAYNMQKYLRENSRRFSEALSSEQKATLYKWIDKSIGTVHTFQGKQADKVILLLGGNPDKLGAINWASSYPNLLNVAITRAKNLLFVVGNHSLWSTKPYFQELSSTLPTLTPEEMFQNNVKQESVS